MILGFLIEIDLIAEGGVSTAVSKLFKASGF